MRAWILGDAAPNAITFFSPGKIVHRTRRSNLRHGVPPSMPAMREFTSAGRHIPQRAPEERGHKYTHAVRWDQLVATQKLHAHKLSKRYAIEQLA
jgi:hypothetical protein